MRHKLYPVARRRIIEIWHYTDKTWGEKQADKYVRGEIYPPVVWRGI